MSNASCLGCGGAYSLVVPKLWTDTIDAHRHHVREAVLAAAAGIVAEQGLRAVTMSQIAERAGIGRATLYKYFPDLDSILRAWHEQQIQAHLAQLAQTAQAHTDPYDRLAAVLTAYAQIAAQTRGPHDPDLMGSLHRDPAVTGAETHLHAMVTGLIAEAAQAHLVRTDVSPAELATFTLHALAAARVLPQDAGERLVALALDGLTAPAKQARLRK